MTARFTPGGAGAAIEEVRAEGLAWREWGNSPGDAYGAHAHDYDKILVCKRGSITFHTASGDHVLRAGDRLDLPAHTEHSATVGSEGCACAEAWILD